MRGLSGLYIMKRLMFLCEEIETGRRATKLPVCLKEGEYEETNCFQPDKKWGFLNPHISSEDCGWFRDKPRPSATVTAYLMAGDRPHSQESPEEIRASVKRCFDDDRVSRFKPCHYFDYFAGTSSGG